MRVLVDTNVLVRAVYSLAGPAGAVVRLLTENLKFRLILSRHILDEARRILEQSRIQRRTNFSPSLIRQALAVLEAAAEMADPVAAPNVISDPNDQRVIEAALGGGADVIRTLDKHFDEPKVQGFCRAHGIRILNDVELLSILRGLPR